MSHTYDDIISVENLLDAWREFVKGKRKRKDVQEFQLYLMDNILALHLNLKNKTYHHGNYEAFNISDPKPRNIHKASVRDRLLHHAIYRILYPYFDQKFIFDSYSCRLNKGTHKAINRFRQFAYIESDNHTRNVWVLKCDIKKFFASIDHEVLLYIIAKHIEDKDTVWLLNQIISSFHSPMSRLNLDIGVPLGNLTSQLLVNIYMNEFDQFVKRELKAKYYIRYADDFVFFSQNKTKLITFVRYVAHFLESKLKLELHPDKVFIKTLSSGVDFLGWVHFPDHRVLRSIAKRRMLKRLAQNPNREAKASYLGLIKHGNSKKLIKLINY